MLNHDELDLDTTIYKPWDFHAPQDCPPVFPLGGRILLCEAQGGMLQFNLMKLRSVNSNTKDEGGLV